MFRALALRRSERSAWRLQHSAFFREPSNREVLFSVSYLSGDSVAVAVSSLVSIGSSVSLIFVERRRFMLSTTSATDMEAILESFKSYFFTKYFSIQNNYQLIY